MPCMAAGVLFYEARHAASCQAVDWGESERVNQGSFPNVFCLYQDGLQRVVADERRLNTWSCGASSKPGAETRFLVAIEPSQRVVCQTPTSIPNVQSPAPPPCPCSTAWSSAGAWTRRRRKRWWSASQSRASAGRTRPRRCVHQREAWMGGGFRVSGPTQATQAETKKGPRNREGGGPP
jgi:hypothetical protein